MIKYYQVQIIDSSIRIFKFNTMKEAFDLIDIINDLKGEYKIILSTHSDVPEERWTVCNYDN